MSEATTSSQPHQPEPYDGARIVLSVPRACVKEVKSALESQKIFDRHHGISPEPYDTLHASSQGQRMRVPTTIPCSQPGEPWAMTEDNSSLLAALHLNQISPDIEVLSSPAKPIAGRHNPLLKALREALEALPWLSDPAVPNLTIDRLVATFPDSYSIYKPLLLLPSNSLSQDWQSLITAGPDRFIPVWQHVASAMQCTHIALNNPIPASNTPCSAYSTDASNVLRSPVHLVRIHGSFGPAPDEQRLRRPGKPDFDAALWVSTTQNGIHQAWAPLYTMFSRGNVKEKARVLHLPCVERGATAVDMYAGIGYFSFSYRRAGTARVLCWELNPWSIEGLRRGAALNTWTTRVFSPADIPSPDGTEAEWEAWREGVVAGNEDFWVFAMSNEIAPQILHYLRDYIPPIRHVNLGLLPLSRESWPSAAGAVDRRLGGWVHAHENVGVEEMDERRVEVEREFQRLANECVGASASVGAGAEAQRRKVQVEHVERVKMYAPGVVHAVFDVHIPGTQTAE